MDAQIETVFNPTRWKEACDQIYNTAKETLWLVSVKSCDLFDENDQFIKNILSNKNTLQECMLQKELPMSNWQQIGNWKQQCSVWTSCDGGPFSVLTLTSVMSLRSKNDFVLSWWKLLRDGKNTFWIYLTGTAMWSNLLLILSAKTRHGIYEWFPYLEGSKSIYQEDEHGKSCWKGWHLCWNPSVFLWPVGWYHE